ncbi:DUF2155 domain-containing protein [Paraurantiacibacter namhicola]|uniref:DUF2155 domain-containing protein n=1 Tax=Paraurantiacibacter namhicola TaxID=645517 RepID=A0A1C7D6I1_9SPHN|nr:DUF2155 domain-containing protein [Paraurantiacibacter namhicola]ANU07096.1 hypothetical protein A6F65_00777 [Paraurantiacibacter namhicola]
MRFTAALAASAALLLGACKDEAPAPRVQETEVPEDLATMTAPAEMAEQDGTPMEERVATLGLLNKRNNISQDIELKPGESRRVGDVIVRLSACERTAPYETAPDEGAFVQVLVNQRPPDGGDAGWQRVFSGWLFKNKPSINVVEHPVYDVWVKSCAMTFDGEAAPPPSAPEPSETAASDSTEA